MASFDLPSRRETKPMVRLSHDEPAREREIDVDYVDRRYENEMPSTMAAQDSLHEDS